MTTQVTDLGSGEDTTRRMTRRANELRLQKVVLRVMVGPEVGLAFDIRPGTWIVGRSRRADVRLRSPLVSRAHAKVVMMATGIVDLFDLGATNPTRVNGVARPSCGLRDGDRLAFGDVEMEVSIGEPKVSRRPKLTRRELEIARAVMDGLTNVAIGQRLCISPRTVGTHLSNVYERLGINTRAELTRYLLERGVSA